MGTLTVPPGWWRNWRNRGKTWEALTDVKEKSSKQQDSIVVSGMLGKVLGVLAARWERPGWREGYMRLIMVFGPPGRLCGDFAVGRFTSGCASWTTRLSLIKFYSVGLDNQLFSSAQFFNFAVPLIDKFQNPIMAPVGTEELGILICCCDGIMKEDVISRAVCWTMNFHVT